MTCHYKRESGSRPTTQKSDNGKLTNIYLVNNVVAIEIVSFFCVGQAIIDLLVLLFINNDGRNIVSKFYF